MRDQAEQRRVALRQRRHALLRQVAPLGDQRRAGAVLEAAIAVIDRVEHEHVALERRLRFLAAVPERDLRFADLLRVVDQALAIEARPRAGDDELVRPRHAPRMRRARTSRARTGDRPARRSRRPRRHPFDVLARGHRRRHLPAARQLAERDRMRLVLAALDAQAQAGAVEEAARRIEKRCAHGGVEGIDEITQRQRRAPLARRLPGRLVELRQRHRLVALPRFEPRQMARELAHHVAAGNPHRQRQALRRGGRGHRQRDAELMRMQIVRLDAVGDHSVEDRGMSAIVTAGLESTAARIALGPRVAWKLLSGSLASTRTAALRAAPYMRGKRLEGISVWHSRRCSGPVM